MVSKEVLSPITAFPAGLSTPFNIFLTGTEQKKCSSSQERIVYNHSIKKNWKLDSYLQFETAGHFRQKNQDGRPE